MLVKSAQDYEDVLKQFEGKELVALDTETEMFTEEKDLPEDLKLDGVGLYTEGAKAYLPFRFLDKRLQNILDFSTLVFHNAKFDLRVLRNHGFDIDKIKFHDTMIMSWLLNENRSHALKDLAGSVLKVDEEKITRFKNVLPRPVLETYGMFPEEYDLDLVKWEDQLGLYCIDDCKYTYKLFNIFNEKLTEQDLQESYLKLELPFIRVVADMETRGIAIDTAYLTDIGKQMEQKLVEFKATVWKNAGREFDINSAKQLSNILYKEKNYTVSDEHRTPKGEPSTNVQAMTYLKEKYPDDPLVQSVLAYREIYKLHSTYIVGLLEKQRKGIIHPSFRQHGTETGRLSCSNPNLQQLPRRSDGFNIRKAFIPREGHVFVISDLSQIELRVAAFLCKDPILVRAFQEGKDVHQETADALDMIRFVKGENMTEAEKKKEARGLAKTVNFGLLYSRSAYGMHKGLNMNPKEAEAFIEAYFAKFKNFKILIEQAKNTLKKHYAIRTLFKRKRRFPGYPAAKKSGDWKEVAGMERQALNSIIQGSAADIIKLQMRLMWEQLKPYDAHLLVTIHDEVIVEVPEAKAEEVLVLVKSIMESNPKLGEVPLVADSFIANCWKK